VFGLSERWPLDAQVLALRLLSVAFGAVFLWASFRLFVRVFPKQPGIALVATAFAATVPMHVAVTAAVNNDALANLWAVASIALLLAALRTEPSGNGLALGRWAWAGVAMGLGMLTKTTAYAVIPVGLIALIGQSRRSPSLRGFAARALALFGPALALNIPWYVRNMMTYGGIDILGLQRHNAIVLGQPTTAEWLGRLGWGGVAKELLITTFRSFWAQFGWMGVLVDQRIYQALALFSLLVFLGLLLYLLRARVNRHLLTPFQWRALGVLGLWFLSTAFLYLWYNVQFVQHQGRYFFPALPAIALAAALGFTETLRPTRARLIALLSTLGIAASLGLVLLTERAFKTLSLLLGLSALTYTVIWRVGMRWVWVWQAAMCLALLGLDMVCLFRFIVPYFTG
jgi:4-amino-4-deoxy-L-arabinose transferase-like glycosyltransferase